MDVASSTSLNQHGEEPPSRLTGTAGKLVDAAMHEFCESGYHGTDTNKIAKRAGFSPQTFYRWFRDKGEIFIAAYRRWEDEERAVIESLHAEQAAPSQFSEAILAHHRRYRVFRRSLRQLAVESNEIRQARAESRERQAERLLNGFSTAPDRRSDVLLTLLQIERLADAAADEETADLGIHDDAVCSTITSLLIHSIGVAPA